jgi:hypothetical protein
MADSFLSQHMIAVKMATIKQNRYKRGTTFLENSVPASAISMTCSQTRAATVEDGFGVVGKFT